MVRPAGYSLDSFTGNARRLRKAGASALRALDISTIAFCFCRENTLANLVGLEKLNRPV
jgi:hypothetical protein